MLLLQRIPPWLTCLMVLLPSLAASVGPDASCTFALEYSRKIPATVTHNLFSVEEFDEVAEGHRVHFHVVSRGCELHCSSFQLDFGDGANVSGEIWCNTGSSYSNSSSRNIQISHVYENPGRVSVAMLLNTSMLIGTELMINERRRNCYRFAAFIGENESHVPKGKLIADRVNELHIRALQLRNGEVYDVTEEFISLGEIPVVQVSFAGESLSLEARVGRSGATWGVSLNVPMSPHPATIEIESRTKVSVNRCTIEKTRLVVGVEQWPVHMLPNISFASGRGFADDPLWEASGSLQLIARDSAPCFHENIAVLVMIDSRVCILYSRDAFFSYSRFYLDTSVTMRQTGLSLCQEISCATLQVTDIILLDSGFVLETSSGILYTRFLDSGGLSAEFLQASLEGEVVKLAKNTVCVDSSLLHLTRFAVYVEHESVGDILFSTGELMFEEGEEYIDNHVETFRVRNDVTAKLERVFLHNSSSSFIAQIWTSNAARPEQIFVEFFRHTGEVQERPQLTELEPTAIYAHPSSLGVFAIVGSSLWISDFYGNSPLLFHRILTTESQVISVTSCAQTSEFFVETEDGQVLYGKFGVQPIIKVAQLGDNTFLSCAEGQPVYTATVDSGPAVQRNTIPLLMRVRHHRKQLPEVSFVPSGTAGQILLTASHAQFPFQSSDTGKVLRLDDGKSTATSSSTYTITFVDETNKVLHVNVAGSIPTSNDSLTKSPLVLSFGNGDDVEIFAELGGLRPGHVGMAVLTRGGVILVETVKNSTIAHGRVFHRLARLDDQLYVHEEVWQLVDLRGTDAFRLDVSGAGAALRIKEIADVSVVEIPLSNDYVDVDLVIEGSVARFMDNTIDVIGSGIVTNITRVSVYVTLKNVSSFSLNRVALVEFFTASTTPFETHLERSPYRRFSLTTPACSSGTLDVVPRVPSTLLQPLDQSDLLQLVALTSSEDEQLEFLTSMPQVFLPVNAQSRPSLHGRIVGANEGTLGGQNMNRRLITFQGLPQHSEGRTGMLLRLRNSLTCERHRSEYMGQVFLGCPRFKRLIYNTSLSIPEVTSKPEGEVKINLPINYRPPSYLGEAIPLSPHIYNAVPDKPLYADRFQVSRLSAVFKTCSNQSRSCDCMEEQLTSSDISNSDCIRTAYKVPYKRAFVPRFQVIVANDLRRENLSYSYTLVDLNGRQDYCTNSSRFDATECGNRSLIQQFAFDPHANDAVLFVGQGLYHFQVTLVAPESYCNLTTQFTVFVVNPPLAGPTEAATFACTAIFLGGVIFSAYVYYSSTLLTKDAALLIS